MKALITGATGFIGSHLADYLFDKGWDIRCTIRKTSNLRWLKDKPYELVEASLSDIEALKKAVSGCEYIFHLAGRVGARNYEEFHKANCQGTANLLNAALKSAPNIKRFIFASSQTAVGPSESFEKPVDEMTPCHPLTSYGKSKKAAEDECKKFTDKLPITIIRPPAVYGPRETEIFAIFKTVKSGIAPLIGFKNKYVSLIHSADLVRGITIAAESGKAEGKTYFITSEEFYTWQRLIGIISSELNKKFIIKLRLPHILVLSVAGIAGFFGKFSSNPPAFNYEKGIDFIQDFWTCSPEKAQTELNFHCETDIESGMADTIHWYKNQGWL